MRFNWFLLYVVMLLMSITIFFSCTFNTDSPQVVKVSIRDGEIIKEVDSFQDIDISFSKPMNKYLTEKNISISGYYGVINFEWYNQNRVVKIFLKDGLQKGLEYTLTIGRGSECSEGVNLQDDFFCTFYTYKIEDEFYVVSTFPEDGASAAVKKADGEVVFLTPEGGEVSGFDGFFQIKIDFFLPVEETKIYDKISIEPSFPYTYIFTDNRKTLFLNPVYVLDMNEVYTIRISEELCAESGKSLKEAFSFTFNTIVSQSSFSITSAVMKNTEKDICLNFEDYPGFTSGVEKDMSLFVGFNSDFFLHSVQNLIQIDPPVFYHLQKEEGDNPVLCFIFDEGMVQEETYRITFDHYITDTTGVLLDKDYVFEWVVDGEKSFFLKVIQIEIIDPLGMNNTVVFQDGIFYQNHNMLFRQEGEKNIVEFKVLFSATLDLYPSLKGFDLDFVFGNSQASGGSLYNYNFDVQNSSLELEYSVPLLHDGGDATYKFVISGGEDGIVDTDSNPLEEDLEIYMIYPVPE